MAFYTQREIRDRAMNVGGYTTASADTMLRKEAKSWRTSFDIFLSHAFLDAQLILGVKALLESTGLSVYIDWIDDPALDRSQVTTSTAAQLRERMRQSKALVFATSQASVNSKWMPWELGFFDGLKGDERISILPLVLSSDESFNGQEYLGLYPLIRQLRRASDFRQQPVVTKGRWNIEAKSMQGFVNGTGRYSTSDYR